MTRIRTNNKKVFSIKRTNQKNKKNSYKRYINRKHFRMSNKLDQKLFKAIKGVIYVEGYHYGWRHIQGAGKNAYKPFVSRKAYNFIVGKNTHQLTNMHIHNTASVMTKHGKRWLYITNIHHVQNPGKATLKIMHKRLKPVLAFHNGNMRKKWFITSIMRNVKRNAQKD